MKKHVLHSQLALWHYLLELMAPSGSSRLVYFMQCFQRCTGAQARLVGVLLQIRTSLVKGTLMGPVLGPAASHEYLASLYPLPALYFSLQCSSCPHRLIQSLAYFFLSPLFPHLKPFSIFPHFSGTLPFSVSQHHPIKMVHKPQERDPYWQFPSPETQKYKVSTKRDCREILT